jgi:acyl-CoA synthetase (AMP-forming)/AMP-acid ligase II
MSMLQPFPLLGDHLRHWAQVQPRAEALIWGDRRLDYRSYAQQVDACARALLAIGVKRGDRVAVLAPPRPEVMILYIAAADLGAIFVGLNSKGTLAEFKQALEDARPVVLFFAARAEREYGSDIVELRRGCADTRHFVCLDGRASSADHAYQEFIERGRGVEEQRLMSARGLVRPEDPAVLVYTSGSTGAAKGALVTHRSVLAGMGAQARRFEHVVPFRCLFHVPIHHLGSVGNSGTVALMLGGALIFLDRFSPRTALELMVKEKVTLWGQVPTMFLMQLALDDFHSFDLSRVQAVFFAGSAMPREAVVRLGHLAADLVTGYGSTETCGPVTLSEPGASVDELSETIGRAVPDVEIKIAAADGSEVASNESGEIWARGACIFKGYFNQPAATRAALTEDGWFRTGDLATRDEHGRIRIAGRVQEAFKSGGANVYPREIEDVLQSCPGVALACVVSVPDPVYQEVGYAFIVRAPGAVVDEHGLRAYCAQRLTRYKIPRRFEFREALPTIGIGKVDRTRLKLEAVTAAADANACIHRR